jgi:hypothetical protein
VKFAFIHAEKAKHSVMSLCKLLGVTRQGYYAYSKRPCSLRVLRDQALREQVQRIHLESRGAGLQTSHTSGRRKVGATSRSSSTCSPERSSAGPQMLISGLSCRCARWRTLYAAANRPPSCCITPIGAASTRASTTAICSPHMASMSA